MRASHNQKTLIDRAAEALGRKRSEFMLDSACKEAESVLLNQRYFALSTEEFKRFTAVTARTHRHEFEAAASRVGQLAATYK